MKNKLFLIVTVMFVAMLTITAQPLSDIILENQNEHFVDIGDDIIFDDLDLDGDDDLVFFARPDNKSYMLPTGGWATNFGLYIYENLGSGNYEIHEFIATNDIYLGSVYGFKIFDINQDGYKDIAMSSGSDQTTLRLRVYYGGASLNYTHQDYLIPEISSYYNYNIEDIDSDGDLDILSTDGNLLYWAKNDGQMNFSLDSFNINVSNVDVRAFFRVSDLNGDNYQDITTRYSDGDNNYLIEYINDGNEVFTGDTLFTFPYSYNQAIVSVDIDNDGDLDYMVKVSDGELYFYENIGSGNYEEQLFSVNVSTTGSIEIGDLDGDGDNDLFDYNLGFFENDGNQNFTKVNEFVNTNNINAPFKKVILQDMDGDGDLDFLLTTEIPGDSSFDGELVWIENNPSIFPYNKIHELSTKNNNYSGESLGVYDIDGDGDSDILVSLGWYENLGNGEYKKHFLLRPISWITHSAAGDMDGDGDMDIVASSISSYFNGSIHILINDGNQNFLVEEVITGGDHTEYFELKDMDNDGDLDILARGEDNPAIIVWFEQADDSFFEPNEIEETISASSAFNKGSFTAEDIDLDGDLDIVVGRSKLAVYYNDGNQNFTETIVDDIQTIKNFIIDFDGDGDLDILVIEKESRDIYYFENNNGEISFSRVLINIDADSYWDYIFFDIDNDGDIDFLNVESNQLIWYSNFNNQYFFRQVIPGNFITRQELSIGDVDDDMENELFTLSKDSSTISITLFNPDFENYGTVYTNCFYDINENQILDSTEIYFTDYRIELLPSGSFYYGNEFGHTVNYLENGNYTIKLDTTYLDGWELSTNADSYQVDITSGDFNETYSFGIKPKESIVDLINSIHSPNFRCSEEVLMDISSKNLGTTILDGVLWLELDENITGSTIISEPDTTVGDYKMGWFFENLFPSQEIKKSIRINIPGVLDGWTIGDVLTFKSYSDIIKVNEDITSQETDIFDYTKPVLCSYDPNDKTAYPSTLIDEDNYTLFGTGFIYRIRFQNTGNDVAYNVFIEDEIEGNLDINSLRILSTSHPNHLRTSVDGQLVRFEFDNIFLPDSTSNPEGSQGYVTYKITPKEGLGEYTGIQNTAYIYFDLNPPVITNTTNNILVSQFPMTSNEDLLTIDNLIKIQPNPANDHIQIIQIEKSLKIERINLLLGNGQLVKSMNIDHYNDSIFMNVSELMNGVYFLEVKGEGFSQTYKILKF